MGTAEVSFLPAERPGRSEVVILMSDQPQAEPTRTSWYIVAQHEPSGSQHGQDADASDLLCLF
jgi:hypothetical protein